VNRIPEPATRSFTVLETSTSPAPASPATRDMYGDATDVLTRELDLARVQTRPDFDPKRPDRTRDGAGAADRHRGPVERGEQTVAREFDLAALVPLELPPYDLVVRVEEGALGAIPERGETLGRADDVGEEHGGEDAVDFRNPSHARQELLDLA
jgi:hypothetical protein